MSDINPTVGRITRSAMAALRRPLDFGRGKRQSDGLSLKAAAADWRAPAQKLMNSKVTVELSRVGPLYRG